MKIQKINFQKINKVCCTSGSHYFCTKHALFYSSSFQTEQVMDKVASCADLLWAFYKFLSTEFLLNKVVIFEITRSGVILQNPDLWSWMVSPGKQKVIRMLRTVYGYSVKRVKMQFLFIIIFIAFWCHNRAVLLHDKQIRGSVSKETVVLLEEAKHKTLDLSTDLITDISHHKEIESWRFEHLEHLRGFSPTKG